MIGRPLSVIVVSRHRPAALVRCVKGLMQLDHVATEIIVVADPAGVAAVRAIETTLKVETFDEANISAARNIGLARAAGDVVAFIDDDAVPEPTWASRLIAPFDTPEVIAATGFVRGRNGISYQWRSSQIDAMGQDHPLDVPTDSITLRPGLPTRAVKTQGTNCAFRASALRAIGGFDPAFRFYLDEADVNLRMAVLGLTAIVPGAQVHHGFEASERRREDRVPLDLTEIAASTAVFVSRHAPQSLTEAKAHLWRDQHQRTLRHMIAGRIEPRDVQRLMATLANGWDAGLLRDKTLPSALPPACEAFCPLKGLGPRSGKMIVGRSWQMDELLAEAASKASSAQIITVVCLSPGWRRHHHHFDSKGFWVQTGGIWGRSVRSGPRPGAMSMATRVALETKRIAEFRPV